jgi:hypothetical protein
MASQATKQQAVAKPTVVKTLPQQAGRLAAAFLANVSAAKMALADELSLPELSYPDVTLPDVSSLSAGGVGDFLSEYSLIIGGGALLLAIPIGISALGKGEAGTKAVTPEQALAALAEDPRVVLVDIRSTAEIKAQGAPNLRSVKRKLVSLPYTKVQPRHGIKHTNACNLPPHMGA